MKFQALKARPGSNGRGQLPLRGDALIELLFENMFKGLPEEFSAMDNTDILTKADSEITNANAKKSLLSAFTPGLFGFAANQLYAGSELLNLASMRYVISGTRLVCCMRFHMHAFMDVFMAL